MALNKTKPTPSRPSRKRRRLLNYDNDRRQRSQDARNMFVAEHKLKCFKCDTNNYLPAKTGFNKFGPWAICANCKPGASKR
jgi:hypothetical protein